MREDIQQIIFEALIEQDANTYNGLSNDITALAERATARVLELVSD